MQSAQDLNLESKGSQFQLRKLVKEHREYLNCLVLNASPSLREFVAGQPDWVSPLASEDYCEYQDKQFLDKVDCKEHWSELKDFWPSGGPVWDALATIEGNNGAKGVILLEAKSHRGELKGTCGASTRSREKIERSFATVKRVLGVKADADWLHGHYQYANRVAHLYFMNIVAEVPTWLVFLYFVGDTKPKKGPQTVAGWETILDRVRKKIGLPNYHLLNQRIVTVFAQATPYGGKR
ncbi:hypothetical protein E3J62_11040 [candidate division TA06 bacterium]|uniref:Uncharacterized protein n=1 Tax=candidate division TA06 bacterium TaxID=2250710 RepID=A0A523UP39_UNCT6|nr:MAG: hypothetical protein E3J62_11040 [candidate division TA06 bacterium]